MNPPIVDAKAPVTLVAGGPLRRSELRAALARAPHLVAADGGADRALALGQMPEAVIGDLDSLSEAGRACLGARVHEVPEQETTDFDKALRAIRAPLVIAVGLIGGRADHALAALSGLMRHQAQGGGCGPVIGCRFIRWRQCGGAARGWNGRSTGWSWHQPGGSAPRTGSLRRGCGWPLMGRARW